LTYLADFHGRYQTGDPRRLAFRTSRRSQIGASNIFDPIQLQAFYRREHGYKKGDFPICDRVSSRTFALPSHNGLTEAQVDEVCRTLKSLL